jgi:hypothetical protein
MPRRHIPDLRWNALLSDFRRSGLTHAEFCRRRGISIHCFRKHLYQTPAPKPAHPDSIPATASVATPFVPVTILADPAPARSRSHQSLELILPEGRRIAVAPGFDPDTLRQLIDTLEGRLCSR